MTSKAKGDDLAWVSAPEAFMVKKGELNETFTLNTDFLVTTVEKNLSKPLIDLPVAKDLPRLLKGFEITLVGPPEALVYKDDATQTKHNSVKQIIIALARYIDGEQAADKVTRHLDTLKPEGDIQVELTKLVQSGVFDEKKYSFTSILKAVQQELIYPAVMELRRGIYHDSKGEEKYPYKDVKGTWKIRILIEPAAVTVIHQKWEVCRHEKFKFHWFFEVRRTTDGARTAALNIINYSIVDTIPEEEKKMIYKALKPFLATTAEYNALWSKSNWSLKHDIVSLTDRLTLTDQYGMVLYKKDKEEATPVSARRFLITIATYFEPPTVALIDAGFVKASGDLAEQIDKVLTPDFFAQAPKVVRMLKLLSHDMIYLGSRSLRETVHSNAPFQDVKGSYRVHVQMTITERKSKGGNRISVSAALSHLPTASAAPALPMTPSGLVAAVPIYNSKVSFVVVTHRKIQKSTSPAPKDFFRFEWAVTLKSRRSMEELYSADFRILDVKYSSDTQPQIKSQVETLIKPIYTPKQVGDTVCNVPLDLLMDALIKSSGESTIYLDTLAHSIPYRVALMAMQRALREKKLESVRVIWK